ncbi:MAG: hypothetical protein A3K19_24455 [Lentisphaerae bacterium RIFOXYB12_FULL_65_16]|nr:MAG: hypothetical protein A3K18_05100 [Lentisphaerae bacterium RIFOXYA12_64_32]OGV88207.1 MAG: hypothetical protein A3K19_24455 [Lentisphaerae bacterium RIFOXYB12_FULL_65_16]
MKGKIGFDNEKYLAEQTAAILERVGTFGGKLYLEFGGKLLFDYHAARVLPGFDPNVKMRLLQGLKDKADIILCIYAGDIERKKVRADFGITYDTDALKLIDDFRERGLDICAVVITRFDDQPAATVFKNRLERQDIRVYTHRAIRGYPADINRIVSDEGYGANAYIETKHPLVVMTAPGPGSGKLSTCLSQLYHDYRQGRKSGYAKFETFPIWSLPLKHPVNVAYEAATADLRDFNLIDPFHLEAYQKTAINYNRDVDAFPVVKAIFERITGAAPYRSPTDMGVNRAGFGIVDNAVVEDAARQEVIRRYLRAQCEYALGFTDKGTVDRAHVVMTQLNVGPEHRVVVGSAWNAAREAQRTGKGNQGIYCGAAIELQNGTIVTGKNSPVMHAAAAVVLNAVKTVANIPDHIHLLSPSVLESIIRFKRDLANKKSASMDLEDTMIALCISATTNPTAQMALEKLKDLSGCDMHMTHIPSPGDEVGLRRLGVNLTTDTNFPSKNLFLT